MDGRAIVCTGPGASVAVYTTSGRRGEYETVKSLQAEGIVENGTHFHCRSRSIALAGIAGRPTHALELPGRAEEVPPVSAGRPGRSGCSIR